MLDDEKFTKSVDWERRINDEHSFGDPVIPSSPVTFSAQSLTTPLQSIGLLLVTGLSCLDLDVLIGIAIERKWEEERQYAIRQ